MADSPQDPRDSITVLVLEDAGVIGLKVPGFDVELYGEDLPALIEEAEERLWQGVETRGKSVPETATLAIKRVTKEEFGPTCYDLRAENQI